MPSITEEVHDPEALIAEAEASDTVAADDKALDDAIADAEAAEVAEVAAIESDAEIKMLREHDEHCRDLAEEVVEAESELESAQAVVKARKNRVEDLYARLRDAALSRPTFGPLFDGDAAEAEQPPANDPEVWRSVSVEMLDLADNLTGKLLVAKVETLGQVSEVLNKYEQDRNIEGIGEKSWLKISEAMTAWFAANPDKCPAVKSEEPEPAAQSEAA